MDEFEIIGMLRTYINATLVGMGAQKGANCRIQSITKSGNTNTVVFAWTDTDGVTKTSEMEVVDGTDGTNGTNGTDGTDGTDGVGIVSIEKTSTSGLVDTYTITLSDGSTYDFTVTNGSSNLSDLEDVSLTDLADGQTLVWDATNSKWVNTIPLNSISINGQAQTISAGAVDLDVAGNTITPTQWTAITESYQ